MPHGLEYLDCQSAGRVGEEGEGGVHYEGASEWTPRERMKGVQRAAFPSYVCECAQELVGAEAGRGG